MDHDIAGKLLKATKAIWDAYNQHPFVKGIEKGELDKAKFRYYIVQDYLYLQDYAKVFAIGVAKAQSLSTARLFASYIHELLDGEMNLHSGYISKFGVTAAEIKNTPMALDNLSYTSYMLRVAYEEREAEILTVILACACSYEMIAKNMVLQTPKALAHEFYGDWVKMYASSEYAEANQKLLQTLEIMTRDYTEAQIDHLTEIFTICSRYEAAFWDMAYYLKK